MDERVFKYKAGKPIPEWDLRHRLRINIPASPECKDTATIFRINSTFMDVTDQPHMNRQWTAGGILITIIGIGAMLWSINFFLTSSSGNLTGIIFLPLTVNICALIAFSYTAIIFGHNEFFALKRRPIRFNRKEQKIYTIRHRRFFAKPGQGDVTWEVPWNEDSIFCIHKGTRADGKPYHIRHYTVDANGNVVRAFAIGREWEGDANLEGLLSQWNYWCWYMNHGPADLPQPALFFSEHESTLESFLFCMYDFGFQASSAYRIFMMPAILLMTSHRLMALWTCRDPVWPAAVEQVSVVAADDPYDQPSGDTPVGWGETTLAHERHDYPHDPKRKTHDWHGEQDAAVNASLWAADIPPAM